MTAQRTLEQMQFDAAYQLCEHLQTTCVFLESFAATTARPEVRKVANRLRHALFEVHDAEARDLVDETRKLIANEQIDLMKAEAANDAAA